MSDNEARWVQDEDTGAWYYYCDGEMTTGWKDINGTTYYFNEPGGSMGWSKEVDGKYLGSDGRQVKDERWVNTEEDKSGTWYYVGAKERVVTGWNKIGDDFYYFNYPGGSMTYDNTIDGFYLDDGGKIADGTGWLKDEYSRDWYYFSDGEMKTGWIQDGASWYYLNDDGKMATGWKYINGDWYYLHSDGSMATGWVEDDTGWYFLYNNGSMAHDRTFDGYHVNKSGKMVTGTGWIEVDGSWYYFKDDGEVATDWLYNQGNWYYLYPEGSMAKGWIQDKGKGYYLKDDGAMAHDTWIDKYYLNEDGEWVTKEEYIGDNIPIKVTEGAAVTYDGTEISAENDIFTQKGIVQRLANGTVVRTFKNINKFFKYQLLMGMGETNGEEGVIYVTDEQEKLADAGADMLTVELGGEFVAIVANGVRAYKNIKTGEIIYNESYFAGSGAGNIKKAVGNASKGAGEAEDSISRINEIEVEFNYKTKYDEGEYARQLADQEAGMNQLTVDEYLNNRERYIAEGRAIEGNAAQQAARDKALADKTEELRDSGMSLKDAEEQAKNWMDSQAALHNPDQIAGGNASNIGGMGNKRINSSIGSQWRYRIDDVDEQIKEAADKMTDLEKQSTYLNVRLQYQEVD